MRIDEAIETGAVRLISGCPRCDETFKNAISTRGIKDIKVVNLVDLVAEAAGLLISQEARKLGGCEVKKCDGTIFNSYTYQPHLSDTFFKTSNLLTAEFF